MAISATGITADNFFRLDPASFTPPSNVTLRSGGYDRITDGRPFNEILRRRGMIAASRPSPATLP